MLPELLPRCTSRLLLRPLAPGDTDAIRRLYRDWEIAKWLSRLPWPFSPDSAETFVVDAAADFERGSGIFLAVETRATGMFVGTVSLRLPSREPNPWTTDNWLGILGYAITRDEQGNGYASEAAASVVELAFNEMGLERLRATVLRDNAASRRVLERLGFGANLLLVPLETSSVQRFAGSVSASTGLDVVTWIILAAIVGFAIASVAGWATIAWVRNRYDAQPSYAAIAQLDGTKDRCKCPPRTWPGSSQQKHHWRHSQASSGSPGPRR